MAVRAVSVRECTEAAVTVHSLSPALYGLLAALPPQRGTMTSPQRAQSVQCAPGASSRRPELRPSNEIQEQKHADQEQQQTDMEAITFSKDTVLSDVHIRIQQKRQLMVRLNAVGQPVFQTQFKILRRHSILETASNKEETSIDDENESLISREATPRDKQALETLLDDDGDLEVQRRPPSASDRPESPDCIRDVVCPTILTIGSEENYEEESSCNNEDVIKIEHTMATPLEDVGKQIWRGAFLLADYILWQQDLFRGCTALELGAGTGFTSIIMATVAKTVICTAVPVVPGYSIHDGLFMNECQWADDLQYAYLLTRRKVVSECWFCLSLMVEEPLAVQCRTSAVLYQMAVSVR